MIADHEHGGVIALASEVAKEHAGKQRGIPCEQAGVILGSPSRRNAVGMHDQESIAWPCDFGALHAWHLVADNAGLWTEMLRRIDRDDPSVDVARTAEAVPCALPGRQP